ncbi:uncharacterized protein LOC120359122 [Solenopsis invicta]|uniref:uncharacterized protein LOC120359122 n=1 Tax=Solenopsis invicta TaxID=13686 RepID=UPI00193DA3E2|nr:uncharacterized protein LOC120359122 [Solenopsis invicta]
MTRISQYCININRILLIAVGLWPYKQSKLTRFQCIFFCVILSSGIIFQVTPLITLKCTMELVIKVLSSVSFCLIFLIQYNTCCLKIELVKNLLMQLEHIHNKLTDKNEIAIVYKYSGIGQRYTVMFTALAIGGLFIITISQIWLIAAVDSSINASESHYVFIMEYFIDQEKYFYLVLLHTYVVICVGVIVIVTTSTMVITYVEHTCGMFKIASYRIEHAVHMSIQNTLQNKILMTKGIICAVDIHRQAMKMSEHFVALFEKCIFVLTGCSLMCFTLNLFQLSQTTSFTNNYNKLFLPSMYAIISVLYMLIANYIGQSVIDHNNDLFVTVYNVQWYKSPLYVQRMILFLLQRGTKKFTLNICGLYDGSIEWFATLMKAAVSYFTLMHSVQS